MKQQITQTQLDELNNKQYWKLRDWMDKKKWEFNENGRRLTIGQMIEFLDEQKNTSYLLEGFAKLGRYEENELCDALWQAVVEVLEKI